MTEPGHGGSFLSTVTIQSEVNFVQGIPPSPQAEDARGTPRYVATS